MNKLIKTSITLMAAFALLLPVFADGLRNPPEGMTGLGKIGGKIVYNDDASTVTHNPANLTEQDGPSIIVSGTYGYGTKEFTDQLGRTTKSQDNSSFLPNVFLAVPIDDNLVAGLGITTPYGRSTTFSQNSALRYSAAYFTELYAVNINPNLAYKVNDRISIAGGIDFLYSELDFKQVYPWSLISGTPDGESRIQADGTGIGYNGAITWNITDKQKAAITYKSSTDVDYDGTFDISGKPSPMMLPFPLSLARDSSDVQTAIEFPAVLAVGYGVQVTDKLRVEANVEWVEHSAFKSLNVDAGSNNVLLPSTITETKWDDNLTYGLGADYTLNDNWIVRAGVIYLETPIPSETMLPSIAEEDQTVVSVGVGYQNGDHRIDAAYALGIFNGRTVSDNTNPAFNGAYDFEAHLLGISYGIAL